MDIKIKLKQNECRNFQTFVNVSHANIINPLLQFTFIKLAIFININFFDDG